jgi:hypothetical protein
MLVGRLTAFAGASPVFKTGQPTSAGKLTAAVGTVTAFAGRPTMSVGKVAVWAAWLPVFVRRM